MSVLVTFCWVDKDKPGIAKSAPPTFASLPAGIGKVRHNDPFPGNKHMVVTEYVPKILGGTGDVGRHFGRPHPTPNEDASRPRTDKDWNPPSWGSRQGELFLAWAWPPFRLKAQ